MDQQTNTDAAQRFTTPTPVSDVDMAFGGRMAALLPAMETIPAEFKQSGNKWVELVARWFFKGLPKGTTYVAKEGVDAIAALRHVGAILASFEPKHEHKEAGCACLLSLWFDDIEVAA
jgi:hypothetical protein